MPILLFVTRFLQNPYAKLNLSKRYGKDYASIFNIILWTSVFLIAGLIATAGECSNLDKSIWSTIH